MDEVCDNEGFAAQVGGLDLNFAKYLNGIMIECQILFILLEILP